MEQMEKSASRSSRRLHEFVVKRCSPRSAMILMLLATTATGSVISFTLLHMGVSHFSVRYAIAVLAAFIAAGVALDWYAPGARTLNGAWQVHLARLAAR